MGVDFISATKKSVRKSLSVGYQQYSNPTLLQKRIRGRRVIKVTPLGTAEFPVGTLLEVSSDGSRIVVCHQMTPIGVNENPPPSVLKRLLEEGGITMGMLDNVSPEGDFANIALFEDEKDEE